MRTALSFLLGALLLVSFVGHFVAPQEYVRIVPAALPAPLLIVQFTGVLELLFGLALFFPRTRRIAAWLVVAFFVAVFPANINMAINHIPMFGMTHPVIAWLRLPFQGVLIAWAVYVARGQRMQGQS
jgi:uncharacterized membrane protein